MKPIGLLLLAFAFAAARPATAQWVVYGAVGRVEHEAAAARIGTESATLGLRHDGRRWFDLSAGIPLGGEAPAWGAAGLGGRETALSGGLDIGVDWALQGFAYRARELESDGGGVTVEAIPYARWRSRSAAAEAGFGGRSHTSVFAGERETRNVAEGRLRVSAFPTPAVALHLVGREILAEEGSYPFAAIAGDVFIDRVRLTAEIGRWAGDSAGEVAWSARAELPLTDRLTIGGGLERQAPDPLYWNPVRRTWTLEIGHALGPRGTGSPVSVPVLAASGAVEVRVPASQAGTALSIGGDFTDWEPRPMRRVGDDWVISLTLAPGTYRYSFVSADGTWFLPASIRNRADDGFGGQNAILIIAAS